MAGEFTAAGASFALGSMLRGWPGFGWAVATSVSEGKRFHSLSLVATPEMKKAGGDWHRFGFDQMCRGC